MARSQPSGASIAFGPGPMTPAVRAIVVANAGLYLITLLTGDVMVEWFGLTPRAIFEQGRIWQPATYLFIHAKDPLHVLFNMLAVWMFGVDLERRWGTRAFTTYYFVTGIGAGLSMMLIAFLPFASARAMYDTTTIGASGAAYGLLVAWGILFPHRQILFMLIFPLQARVYVAIMAALVFLSALRGLGGPVAEVAHLGGMVVGVLYLKGPKNLRLEFRYRLTKWRMERMRRRFSVHKGGRDDWENRIH